MIRLGYLTISIILQSISLRKMLMLTLSRTRTRTLNINLNWSPRTKKTTTQTCSIAQMILSQKTVTLLVNPLMSSQYMQSPHGFIFSFICHVLPAKRSSLFLPSYYWLSVPPFPPPSSLSTQLITPLDWINPSTPSLSVHHAAMFFPLRAPSTPKTLMHGL